MPCRAFWRESRTNHQRGRAAHEDGRKFRDIVALHALLDVFQVVQSEADNLAGPGHGPRGDGGDALAGAGKGYQQKMLISFRLPSAEQHAGFWG